MNKQNHLMSPDASVCRRCRKYCPKVGCTAESCIWLVSKIANGTVTYRDALMSIQPQPPTFGWKIQELAGTYLGTLWKDRNHLTRFYRLITQLDPPEGIQPSEGRRYFCVLFLCTTSEELCKRTRPCFQETGIDFTQCYTAKMSREHSFMLYVAQCLYEHKDEKLILNLGYSRAVYSQNLRIILHGILIAKYGSAVLKLKGDGGF